MRILVTGHAGFIGSPVVAACQASGHDVRGLDLRPAPAPDGDPGPLGHGPDRTARPGDSMLADIRDPAACDMALEGVDAVVHLAATVGLGVDIADLPDYVSHNDLGTAVLLAAMARAGTRRLVLASSMVVYGEGAYTCADHGPVSPGPRLVVDLAAGRFEPGCPSCGAELAPAPVDEEARLDPRNVYAATKVAQEHLASSWARATDATVGALRLHNVYGPRMPRDTPYAGVAALFRSALVAGQPPRVYEDGAQRRDFVHVGDVAAAFVAVLGADLPPGTSRAYNVGSGTPRTVGDMAAAMCAAAAAPAPRPVVTGEFRLGDVRHITASSQRLMGELGWAPAVGFEDGIAEFATGPPGPLSPTARPGRLASVAVPR